MPDFNEPTDREISAMFGGVSVVSLRPEDLPHFRVSVFEDRSRQEFNERLTETAQFFSTFCPTIRDPEEAAYMAAANYSANITRIGTDDRPQGPAYVLARPSKKISPVQDFANMARINPKHIRLCASLDEKSFIDTHHELAHLDEYVRKVFNPPTMEGSYKEELNAESAALDLYILKGGRRAVVEECVAQRAITGFITQEPKYFLGPALHVRFNEKSNNLPEPRDVWLAYAELRARVTDKFVGRDMLHLMNSEDLQKSILFWDNDHQGGVPPHGQYWQNSIESSLRSFFASDLVSSNPDKRPLFDTLRNVINQRGINSKARVFGAQILDAANLVTPGCAPGCF